MKSKSNLSNRPGDLNKYPNYRDQRHKQFLPLDVPYLYHLSGGWPEVP